MIPPAPMNMIRRIQWRFFSGRPALPFEQQLIERQVAREEAEVKSAAVEAKHVESGLSGFSELLAKASSPQSPGGVDITPEELGPICRELNRTKQLAHVHTSHLQQLVS